MSRSNLCGCFAAATMHCASTRMAYPKNSLLWRLRVKSASARRVPRSGIAMLEFAIVLLFVILPLLIGMLEIGRLMHVCQVMTAGAREGGRQVAAGMPVEDVPDVVTEYLSNAGLQTDNVEVALYEADIDFTNSLIMSYSVAASIPMQDVAWLGTYWFTDPDDRITVQSVWPTTREE
jgi:hypothetical protein